MVATGYGICFVLSALVVIYMAQKGYENVDGHYWTLVIIVPVLVMAYWLKVQTSSADAALVLSVFINLASTLLLAVVLFSLLREIGIRAKAWLKGLVYGLAFAQAIVIWLLFYDGSAEGVIQVVDTGDGYSTAMAGGPFWSALFDFVLVLAIAVIGIGAIAQSRKKTYSRRVVAVYVGFTVAGIVVYLLESLLNVDFSLLPYLFVSGSTTIAFGYDLVRAHDISALVTEHQKSDSTRAYVAMGLDGLFLGCNEKCYEYLPELREQSVDAALAQESKAGAHIYALIDDFKNKGSASRKFKVGDITCACEVSTFSVRRDGEAQGYLIEIRDATEEQRAFEVLSNFNVELNQEVEEKTAHIRQMQHKLVLGMANMVENRDSNTGGHVKRTSDVIQILVEEIQRQGIINLGDELAEDIVRAAPMHDLGKISIDSSILNKPARLTAEEYEIMKTHSTTSGQIVRLLLEGVEEEHFVERAYRVARYHHERWDGKGYPDGLVGEMIPLEARIMAVADVYDALVSKRVYKEPMSFGQAREIMCEGMGTQFDPNMRSVFLGCREQLESYYSAVE